MALAAKSARGAATPSATRQVITLVSATPHSPLEPLHLRAARELLSLRGTDEQWFAGRRAVDLLGACSLDRAAWDRLRELLGRDRIDCFRQPESDRRQKRIVFSDMDSTMVLGETLDDLAARAGVGEQVARITAKAMRGELNFAEALAARVALLEGCDGALLEQTVRSIRLMPGAGRLLAALHEHGVATILVSGGFVQCTEAVGRRLGFSAGYGNRPEMVDGRFTGKIIDPVLDGGGKRRILLAEVERRGLRPADALAVGDGANDLPMLRAAGIGVGYRAKAVVARQLDNTICYGDLTALLYLLGLAPRDR